MHIADITKTAGAHRKRKRIGRGLGSGHGKTCGRGHKGGGARAGWKRRGLQEGGQMTTYRRIKKRGFSNAQFEHRFSVVNVGALERIFPDGAHVTPEAMAVAGLIRTATMPVKILGDGKLSKKLNVEAAKFSRAAEEKIKAAGGESRVA